MTKKQYEIKRYKYLLDNNIPRTKENFIIYDDLKAQGHTNKDMETNQHKFNK
jgi:hypothetical protein